MLINICIINESWFMLARSLVIFSLRRYSSAGGKIADDCQVWVHFPFASLLKIISQAVFINLCSVIIVLFLGWNLHLILPKSGHSPDSVFCHFSLLLKERQKGLDDIKPVALSYQYLHV